MGVDFSDIITDIKHNSLTKKAIVASVVLALIIGCLSCVVVFIYECVVVFTYEDRVFETEHDNKVIRISNPEKYDSLVINQLYAKYGKYAKIYDSSDLSVEKIENRDGKLIVERCICYVEKFDNGEGFGTILNCFSKDYAYIHFEKMGKPLYKGTIVVTYLVYNPNTKLVDDAIEVYDFVISRTFEDREIQKEISKRR